jgi:hypothetical protein
MAMPEVAAMPATVTTAAVTTAMTAAAMTAAAMTAAAVTAALGLCSHVSHHQARHAPTVARQYTPTRAPVANRPVKNLRALFCPFPVISFHLSVL